MTERSSEGLDVRRRKLLFRAWRRGVREMDLIVGRFADALYRQIRRAGLDDFERLIEVPNAELYAWVIGDGSRPRDLRHRRAARSSSLFTIRRLKRGRGGSLSVPSARNSPLARSPAARLTPGRPLTLSGIADGAEGLVARRSGARHRGGSEAARHQSCA